ncbi:hypothetical protein FGB62_21g435 [Gracilaria domingensis]|nr:hypothetical protein FGB62_21g435 [Gracilaria domingensis]
MKEGEAQRKNLHRQGLAQKRAYPESHADSDQSATKDFLTWYLPYTVVPLAFLVNPCFWKRGGAIIGMSDIQQPRKSTEGPRLGPTHTGPVLLGPQLLMSHDS